MFKTGNFVFFRVENAVVKCKYVFINSIQNIPPTTMSIERGIYWSGQCRDIVKKSLLSWKLFQGPPPQGFPYTNSHTIIMLPTSKKRLRRDEVDEL